MPPRLEASSQWAFSPPLLLFHNEMSLLLIFLMGTNMIAGVLIFAGLHRLAAAELCHALPDCGCFGGPEDGRAQQLVQLGAGAEATRVQ